MPSSQLPSVLPSPAVFNYDHLLAAKPHLCVTGPLLPGLEQAAWWRSPSPYSTHPLFHCTVEAFSAVGTFHPDHRAERPFPEEDPGSEGDGFLKEGLPPPSQLQGLKHFLHQVRGPICPSCFLLPFLIFSFYSERQGLFRTKTSS